MNWKRYCKRVRRWARRNPRLLTIPILAATAAVLFVILLCVPKEEPVEISEPADEYQAFLDALGFQESSDNYAAVNRFGYMGRYQLGKLGLQEAGFMDQYGSWTKLANSYGIYSKADFLASKAGQDAAVRAYHERTCHYIKAMGLDKYIGKTYCGIVVTKSGLLASCHLVGVAAMKKGLSTGQHMYDGFHVSAAVNMERFAGYDVSSVWGD